MTVRFVCLLGASAVAIATIGCKQDTRDDKAAPATPPPLFVEISEDAGLVFQHSTGATGKKWFPESYPSGAALFDSDGDGDLDVYCVQSGPLPHERQEGAPLSGNVLFENSGDAKFRDVTERAGVGDTGYGIAVTCGDYDGDGDVDLYLSNFGPNVLYQNNGDGTFTDVTDRAGVGDPGMGLAGAFFDYDLDGHLDLFVVNYIAWTPELNLARPCRDRWGNLDFCSPLVYDAPQRDTLYRNNGDGTFRDVSKEAGIHAAVGTGMGIVVSDLNNDGRLDIYVTNDAMPNHLWIASPDGTFREEALLAGCAVTRDGMTEASMGVVAEDFDFDGDMDLFMPDLSGETFTFYRNDGQIFEDISSQVGMDVTLASTGFGPIMLDYDHDGLPDIFVSLGRVNRWESIPPGRNPYSEPDLLLHQTPDGTFEDVSAVAGPYFQTALTGRGSAYGDVDNDGDMDIVVMNADGPARLLRNECITSDGPAGGGLRRWLMIKAVGTRGHHEAVGARVTVVVGGRERTREVRAACGYGSSNDIRVHFGLGAAPGVDDVLVRWPDGSRERFGPSEGGRVFTVRQGEGTTLAESRGAS